MKPQNAMLKHRYAAKASQVGRAPSASPHPLREPRSAAGGSVFGSQIASSAATIRPGMVNQKNSPRQPTVTTSQPAKGAAIAGPSDSALRNTAFALERSRDGK